MYARFVALLRERGYAKPRVKTMPAFRIGGEALRGGGYDPSERVTADMLEGYDVEQLVCAHARVVTDRGIWICPILLDSPEGRLGDETGPEHREARGQESPRARCAGRPSARLRSQGRSSGALRGDSVVIRSAPVAGRTRSRGNLP